jgi:RIO-like serine/threonine protein kinase
MIEKDLNKKNPYNLNECELLGKGNNGEVYLLPGGKVIKICFDYKSFVREYNILERVNGNKYFPRIYEIGCNYMVRECVNGEILSQHIREYGMYRMLGHNIIEMLKEFNNINFNKIDIRCRDIFVQTDGSLKVIDPKKFYSKTRTFPRHLSKGLHYLAALTPFLEILKVEEPELYKNWEPQISKYISDSVAIEHTKKCFS